MHVLYESLGHPAELELAKHIRALTDAALFFDDKQILMSALDIIDRLNERLIILKAVTMATTIVCQEDRAEDKTMTSEEEWSALEENSSTYDGLQHVLDAASCKIKDAIADIERDYPPVAATDDDYDDTDC
ncbi:MAG TPA: hypothetical protein H9850_04955 [Candidatus Anaerobiospirillum pullistercoris]|uniref:Uncharacterized protein n=1 Tax=Candidatus Anaerobiospirillum pullistercoris TaxID=2838452 RepID=A0A9D1WDG2_9GAMM|nr:hypothetical protein [Candidatus Anaerobiospirillum pullistercoris]